MRGGGAGTRDVQQKKVPGVADISACVDTCCNDTLCHVAMLSAGHCLLVSCAQDSFCLPVELRPSAEYNSSLVLVRPPSGGSWDLSSFTSQLYSKEMQGTGLPGPGTLCISNVRQLIFPDVIQLKTNNKEQIALFLLA